MDNDDGKPPLLLRMIEDSDDLKFMLVLPSHLSLLYHINNQFFPNSIKLLMIVQVSFMCV